MDSHIPEVYRELLRQFRDGHAHYGKSLFGLQAFCDQEEKDLTEDKRPDRLERAGSIILPSEAWWVWAVAGGVIGYPSKAVYQKVLARAKAAWEAFQPLAARAGANLPSVIRDGLPAEPADGESWWFSLLWWAQAPCEDEFNPPEQSRRLVVISPFEDSARAIEVCGLAGDTPCMPFVVRFDGEDVVYKREDGGVEQAADDQGGGALPTTPPPHQYLMNWVAILSFLQRKNTAEDRRLVSRLNEEYEGPITITTRGSQPKVEQRKLLRWWNSLEIMWEDAANQASGAKLDAEMQYNHGRSGIAVPGIGGGVKPRRSDRKR